MAVNSMVMFDRRDRDARLAAHFKQLTDILRLESRAKRQLIKVMEARDDAFGQLNDAITPVNPAERLSDLVWEDYLLTLKQRRTDESNAKANA